MSARVDLTSRKAFSRSLGGLSRNCWQGWCQVRLLAAINSRLSVLNRNTEELPERRPFSTGLFPHLMSAAWRWTRTSPRPFCTWPKVVRILRSLARREAGRPAGIAPWYRGQPSLPCATRASRTAYPPTPFRTLSLVPPTSPCYSPQPLSSG